MSLSIRLEEIAACIQPGVCLADIGTDHGYLPIELIKRGSCRHILACDVRTGPLARAQMHIQEAGMQEQIETRLSDGFAQIAAGEVDAAVIAGMGGMLVSEILQAENERPKNILKEMRQLILQPQSDLAAVRQTVHKLSFRIEDERCIKDRDKFYWILVCTPGKQSFEHDWEYAYGRILPQKKAAIFMDYLQQRKKNLSALLTALERQKAAGQESESAARRRAELQKKLRQIQEVEDDNS